jgi:hypothetical protein
MKGQEWNVFYLLVVAIIAGIIAISILKPFFAQAAQQALSSMVVFWLN